MKLCLACEGVTNTAAQRCGYCGAWLLPADAVHYPHRRGERDAGNPLLGTVIDGKYRLQAVLGRGGLGTVFQAVHIGTLITCALKLLHPRFAERPEYRRALLPEARRAATVTHAGCARLLDVGEAEEGVAYLAMELVEGDTIDALMRTGRLSPGHAVEILLQIAAALEAIHAAGLVHCDLSPRNVMVATRGGELRAKVLDFGIARTVTLARPEHALADEFAGFVNPVFSAPELLANEDVDVRADVYSFGSLAWLLLTGSPPVDDAEPRRAAMAVATGELRPWPPVSGVPRRLQRLIERCVEHDRERRPPSATALRQELAIISGSRRPALVRSAVVALGVAVVAVLVSSTERAPAFLRLRAGSALLLATDLASPDASVVQHLQSRSIGTLGLHFGGFRSDRLQVDVSRAGLVLLRAPLRPEVEAGSGTMTLSSAQPRWRELLEGLVRVSQDGPVDISFVVPGRAPLGVARLQLDDEPPHLECRLEPAEGTLTSSSRLVWHCSDDNGLLSIAAQVVLQAGRQLPLPLPAAEGTIDLGALLADMVAQALPLGPGRVTVVARDRAGNVTESSPLVFAAADVQAPHVVEVTGPAGESFTPEVSGVAHLRLRLSDAEPGCVLSVGAIDQAEFWRTALPDASTSVVIEVPTATPLGRLVSGVLWFAVEDAAGNRTQRQFPIALRDQNVRIEFPGAGPGARWLNGELVLANGAASATVAVDAEHRVLRADLELSAGAGAESAVPIPIEAESSDRVRMSLPALPTGSHALRLVIEEVGAGVPRATLHTVPVRVLPAAIEVRVPHARSRFLPGLLDAGVLVRRGTGYREGPAWRIDPALLPYVRGALWIGATSPVPVRLPDRQTASDPLLPEVTPVRGHNVFAVELRDVLDRRVTVSVDNAPAEQRRHDQHAVDVIADFWWHDGEALLVGEELLVEHGQGAVVRVRLPLPFTAADTDDILLGIAQGEVKAAQVTTAGDGAEVVFDLPFAVWSVAARLAGRDREDYSAGLTSALNVTVVTPAGRYGLELRVRTTRSTLEPFVLSQISSVPPELAGIRLLPVLAPSGPFAEPLPAHAPPRALFRPQIATAVRDMTDFLLQEREFTCGEARALMTVLERARRTEPLRFVHRDDPLGVARLRGAAMLPEAAATAPADVPLTDVDFFQAWTYCRLLGFAVAGDPLLFRLPLGCELELAAYTPAQRPACNGVAASGGAVAMTKFLAAGRAAAAGGLPPSAAASRDAGDVVPAGQGSSFVGLDFGVREWVADLPQVSGAELLLREWIGDHATHLARVATFADGREVPPPDLAGPLRTLGVVRGLALGDVDGLVDARGARPDLDGLVAIPDTVPGVLRTEQLRRDGRDLLTSQRDPRLRSIGFRVAGAPAALLPLRGRR